MSGGGYPANTTALKYEAQLPRFDGGSGTVSANGVTSTAILYVTYIKHYEHYDRDANAAIGGGVLKSADGGVTWTDASGTIYSGTETTAFATVDTAGNLLVARTSAKYLYKLSRAGFWTRLSTTYAPVGIAVDASNPQRIFIAGQGGGLARSLNGGTSWTDLGGRLTFSATQPIRWLTPSPLYPQHHYISLSGLYMDPSGKLWINCGNDGIITATPNDATDTSANPPVWTSSSAGIEEMVAEEGVLPPGGKPALTVEDESLFTISDPDTFTALHFPIIPWGNGNNGLSSGQDISYAPNQPLYMAQTSANAGSANPLLRESQFGGYSDDGGLTWILFPSVVTGTHPCVLYDGLIAVSTRPVGHENDPPGSDNLVWMPSNAGTEGTFGQTPAPFFSKDGGASWTQTASFNGISGSISEALCGKGTPFYMFMPPFWGDWLWGDWVYGLRQHNLVADPMTPGTFYAHLTAGGFWRSTDGGVTWTRTTGSNQVAQRTHHGQMAAVPGVSGDLWYVDGREGATAHGLYHTTNGGNSFTRSGLFDYAWVLALGKPVSGATYPTIYVYGRYTGDPKWGIFQSTNGGTSFNRISYYPYGLFDWPVSMAASWDVFGTVYLGFQGNSFYYCEYYPPNVLPAAPSITPGDGSLISRFGSSVSVTLASTTTGATIWYTTDGSTPTETKGTVYTAPITITATPALQQITLKAIAYAGDRDSPISNANFVIQLGLAKARTQAATPTFSPAGGVYTAPQLVTIASTTPGAAIRYTTDGTTPTPTTGTLYIGTPVTVATTTLNAIAYRSGNVPSSVASQQWQLAVVPANRTQASKNETLFRRARGRGHRAPTREHPGADQSRRPPAGPPCGAIGMHGGHYAPIQGRRARLIHDARETRAAVPHRGRVDYSVGWLGAILFSRARCFTRLKRPLSSQQNLSGTCTHSRSEICQA